MKIKTSQRCSFLLLSDLQLVCQPVRDMPTEEHPNLINVGLTTTPYVSGKNERQASSLAQCQRATPAFIKVHFGNQGVCRRLQEERPDERGM